MRVLTCILDSPQVALLDELEKQAAALQKRAFGLAAQSTEPEHAATAVQAAVRGKQGRKAAVARHQEQAAQQQVMRDLDASPAVSRRFPPFPAACGLDSADRLAHRGS